MKLLLLMLLFTNCIFAQTVIIGKQVWMTKNLNVSTFRNGDTIPEAKTNDEWRIAGEKKQPAWCYYNNDPANGAKYGKLYNWYAVTDPRGLAPQGYHIPSMEEWKQLSTFLGGDLLAGKKMKSTTGWNSSEGLREMIPGNGTNTSKFNGLPGGNRDMNGWFSKINQAGQFWTMTEANQYGAYIRQLFYVGEQLDFGNFDKERGLSVRCLKN